MRSFKLIIFLSAALIFLAGLGFAQTNTRRTTKKTTRQAVKPTPTPVNSSETIRENTVKTVTKKNERPTNGNSATQTNAVTQSNSNNSADPVYSYEFTQPNFLVTKIYIEYDDQGTGKITFEKRDFGEAVTDPLQLSPATLEKLKNAFQALDFINSKESYQYEKDYSHLGTIKIRVKKDGRERTAEFNYTDNREAKILMDEYRKIAQQFVWIFDINVARQNQPLNAPALMDTLDGYLRRSEISDPPQLIPFLTELSNDERIPLIARNHAAKLIKEIEKQAAKTEKK